MITHCEPVAESDSPLWIFGIAIATIVWSTNIIATAKIIAVRTRYLLCRALIRSVPPWPCQQGLCGSAQPCEHPSSDSVWERSLVQRASRGDYWG